MAKKEKKDRLISTSEAAQIIFGSTKELHRKRVIRMIEDGSLEGKKVGFLWFFKKSSVDAVMQ